MSLDPVHAGEALQATAGELHRIWRAARAQVRPQVFPGLADDATGRLLDRAAEALLEGAEDARAPYRHLGAIVRLDPRHPDSSEAEIETEWRLLAEVLRATCEALDAGDATRDFLARAVEAAREGASELVRGNGPPGILRVQQLSGFAPPRRRRDAQP